MVLTTVVRLKLRWLLGRNHKEAWLGSFLLKQLQRQIAHMTMQVCMMLKRQTTISHSPSETAKRKGKHKAQRRDGYDSNAERIHTHAYMHVPRVKWVGKAYD